MHPELFRIGSLTIYTHGVLAVFGIIFGSYLLHRLAGREKLDTAVLADNIIYAVLIGIIGARLTYFLLYRDQFSNFSQIFYLWQGGMVSYGGFIPGILTFVILLKAQRANINEWLGIAAIAFPAGLFWGRIGNLFAGEYAGITTISKFSIAGRIPVTFYEALLLAAITLSLYLIYLKTDKQIAKYLFPVFVLLYTSGRFVIDFWRDESKIIFNLSVGQLTSLSLFIFFLLMIIYMFIQERRNYQNV